MPRVNSLSWLLHNHQPPFLGRPSPEHIDNNNKTTSSPQAPSTLFPTEGVLPSLASIIAVDDVINVPRGTTDAFISVLDNDTGSNLAVRTIASQPNNGECSISLDLLEVVYFPNNTTFVGSDQCTYETCDEDENCDTAVVKINIGNGATPFMS